MTKFGFLLLKRLSLLLIIVGLCFPAIGQDVLKVNAEKSSIVVEGGSTLKDWQATAGTIEGQCTVARESGLAISSAQVKVEGKTLDGGRGPDMNAKILKALKVEDHPHVTFVASEANIVENNGGQIKVKTSGTLEIAGKSLPAEIDLQGTAEPLELSGTHKLTFSQYDIEPPSALFGTIVCEDEITIQIKLVFE